VSPSSDHTAPTNSLDVRERLVEALKLDLVGPWAGHALADERLPGWERPSSRYLTGFLIPSATAPEKKGDDDEDDELDEVPAAAGPAEESNEERKAATRHTRRHDNAISKLLPTENTRDVAVFGIVAAMMEDLGRERAASEAPGR
jgi:hypothetical protein